MREDIGVQLPADARQCLLNSVIHNAIPRSNGRRISTANDVVGSIFAASISTQAGVPECITRMARSATDVKSHKHYDVLIANICLCN